MPEPLVTIIIPTFDRPAYLERALASARGQDYSRLEIIVADNASGPGTRAAVEPHLADPRVKYFRNETNIGMYPNWKAALARSTGEWTLVLSDDDFLTDPSFVSSAMDLYAREPGIVMVIGDHAELDEETGRLTPFRKKAPDIADGRWWFMENKRGGIDMLPAVTLFRRAAAPDIVFFDHPELTGCDGADFLRLALNGKVGHVPRPAAAYRVHGGNEVGRFDLDRHLANLGYIEIAHDYASARGAFPAEQLAAWRQRLISGYLDYLLRALCARNDPSGLGRLRDTVREKYPFALRVFRRPSNLLRTASFRHPSLFGILRLFKRLLDFLGFKKRAG